MSTNPRHDALHTMRCAVSDQIRLQGEIATLTQQLDDARRRLELAKISEESSKRKYVAEGGKF